MRDIEHLVLLTLDHKTEHYVQENITWGFHCTYSTL